MYGSLRVAVVIPAYNESAKITETVAGVPACADRVYVIDDASRDDTATRAAGAAPAVPVEVIRHAENRGVGAAIATGYKRALADRCDVALVMAGDGQMDPCDAPALLAPIAAG